MYSNKILDDLSALGHFTNPANQFNFDQREQYEISAYILNAETNPFQDIVSNSAVNINNNQSQQLSTNHNNETIAVGEQQNNILEQAPNVISDNNDDAGVSDVDSGHLSSGDDFEDNLSSFQPSEASASPAQLGELDDAQDWILRSEIKIEQTEVAASLPDNFDALFGDADDSSNIFRDLDDIIGAPNAAGAVTDAQPETDLVDIEFSPDEEDVENQLMQHWEHQ